MSETLHIEILRGLSNFPRSPIFFPSLTFAGKDSHFVPNFISQNEKFLPVHIQIDSGFEGETANWWPQGSGRAMISHNVARSFPTGPKEAPFSDCFRATRALRAILAFTLLKLLDSE